MLFFFGYAAYSFTPETMMNTTDFRRSSTFPYSLWTVDIVLNRNEVSK